MIIESIVSRGFQENTWIVASDNSNKALIIDPGSDFERIKKRLEDLKLAPVVILNTHLHPDHLISAYELQNHYEISLYAHKNEEKTFEMFDQMVQMLGFDNLKKPEVSKWLSEDEDLKIDNLKVKIIHTPGHTPGSCCFLIEDRYLFSGDTVFEGSIGRTDLPFGSRDEMRESLKKIVDLPINTKIYPGHGSKTELAKELNSNPYLI
ncbi:MAG TPA: MBL fold metallo-hydrolase [bacterium]|nr:MBL fold metallo-hydrolase [bacterium]